MNKKYPLLISREGVDYWRYPGGWEIPAIAGGDTIDRSGAEALIPEEASREIFQNMASQSAIMTRARRLPNMARQQQRLPVLSGLVEANFVSGEASQSSNTDGRKPTSRALWENKFINAEELAVIVPIPEAVLDDADYDIWAEVRPQIEEAFGKAFDAAVLYGTNAPSTWPDAVIQGATDAGHLVPLGSVGDLYDDIFNEGGVIAQVEEDGFLVNGHVGALSLRAKLRGLRDTQDRPLFLQNLQSPGQYVLDGVDITFPVNGAIDPTESLLFSGDWRQLVYSVRQDLTYKLLDQAVIQDTDGSILYNLAQQDMIGLRAVMRLGWQLPNPVSRVNSDSETRYPFGVLSPAGT